MPTENQYELQDHLLPYQKDMVLALKGRKEIGKRLGAGVLNHEAYLAAIRAAQKKIAAGEQEVLFGWDSISIPEKAKHKTTKPKPALKPYVSTPFPSAQGYYRRFLSGTTGIKGDYSETKPLPTNTIRCDSCRKAVSDLTECDVTVSPTKTDGLWVRVSGRCAMCGWGINRTLYSGRVSTLSGFIWAMAEQHSNYTKSLCDLWDKGSL